MRAPLREPAMILMHPLRFVGERTDHVIIHFRESRCPHPCLRDQIPVGRQAREPEIGEARLPRSEQLPFAANLEVDLGELESVRDVDERVEPALRVFRELVLRTRDEEAVRLLRTATDTSAQLMQLRETE